MSLRLKAFILFLTLGVAPALLLATRHAHHLGDAVRIHVQEDLAASARSAAAELGPRIRALESALHRVSADLGASVGEVTTSGGDARPDAVGRLLAVEPGLESALLSLSVGGGSGRSDSLAWTSPSRARSEGCTVGGSAPTLRIEPAGSGADGASASMALTAHVAPSALLPSARSDGAGSGAVRIVILDAASGVAVTPPPCVAASDLAAIRAMARGPDGLADAGPAGRVRSGSVRNGDALLSLARVPGTRWTVAATAPRGLHGSVTSMQLGHLGLLLLVGGGGALLFSTVVDRRLRSLDELREAAGRIGEGDLAPWLPPPGEDEVGGLSLAVGRMADRITLMLRRLEQTSRLEAAGVMASHLAHEIRNPLSSIRLNLQGLSRQLGAGRLSPDHEPNIRISLREIDRLERTVKAVLQIGGGKDRPDRSPEVFSLHALVREVVFLLEERLRDGGVAIRLDLRAEADAVRADEERLEGVFLNLLLNAFEAMPAGGRITVASSLFLDHDGRHVVSVSVTDTGPGVPDEIRKEIFNPFFTTKSGGSGIGLPVALRSVRDEGGDLFLENPPDVDRGACFVVSLPVFECRLREESHGRREETIEEPGEGKAYGDGGGQLPLGSGVRRTPAGGGGPRPVAGVRPSRASGAEA